MADHKSCEFPRFMIAAEKSGQGKTMITCGLLSLLSDTKGPAADYTVHAFKCGPDYIDPMFHRRVLGIPSHNLDSFFSSENQLCYLLERHGQKAKSLGVIEGVMGYYDGLGGTTDRASAYEVARLTKTPVVLIADASGRSYSVLAAIRGFLTYRPDSQICGVIFNRLSPMLYPGLKEAAERELGISVIGYVPVLKDFTFESRHLGLIMPEEIPEFQKKIKALADRIRPGIDMDALLSLAKAAKPLSSQGEGIHCVRKKNGEKPVIAVAMDQAFCFYYEDNLDTLKAMGAELRYFSPMKDQRVPDEADGLYLGGGYPELYGEVLSKNRSMRESMKECIGLGMPCIAECGGYLYLKEWLFDSEKKRWPMCGVLPGESKNSGKLSRFGYGVMTIKKDGILGPAGEKFPAHEFHHWDCEENGDACSFRKPVGARGWDCGYMTDSLYAGFPHLYFYGHYPYNFLRRAAVWKEETYKQTKSEAEKYDAGRAFS